VMLPGWPGDVIWPPGSCRPAESEAPCALCLPP
jgi:hypothetical protein